MNLRSGALALLLATSLCAAAEAQTKPPGYPDKPIRLITLTPAGGSLDILARTIAQELGDTFGQQAVVENITGAGGNIGVEATARAQPDGYTIGMVTSSTHAINQSLYDNLKFDPINDFAPITIAAALNNVVVVHPSLPVTNIPELIAYLKANPDKVSFGSAGPGTSQHLSGELFKIQTGTKMTHVPYRGAAPAVQDLLTGQFQLMFVSIPDVISHIKSGGLRAIGVTAKTRSVALPDVVPVAEQGLPDFDVSAWFGVVAPKGTPKPIVDYLNAVIVAGLNKPAIKARLEGMGMDPRSSTPEAFLAHIKSETAKWAPVVVASGAKIKP